MKITANIATMKGREHHLQATLLNLYDQFDKIRIVFNGFNEVPWFAGHPKIEPILPDTDLTDNGKFYSLDNKRKEYYFTMDDDIHYPNNYVEKTIEAIEKFKCIVTYHGRILNPLATTYYRGGHEFFHCNRGDHGNLRLDVCGTGVTAFRTDYFCPVGLHKHPYQRMSDLVFSLEVAKQGKVLGLIEKPSNWIIPQEVQTSIYSTESNKKQEKQIELMYEILQTNN